MLLRSLKQGDAGPPKGIPTSREMPGSYLVGAQLLDATSHALHPLLETLSKPDAGLEDSSPAMYLSRLFLQAAPDRLLTLIDVDTHTLRHSSSKTSPKLRTCCPPPTPAPSQLC